MQHSCFFVRECGTCVYHAPARRNMDLNRRRKCTVYFPGEILIPLPLGCIRLKPHRSIPAPYVRTTGTLLHSSVVSTALALYGEPLTIGWSWRNYAVTKRDAQEHRARHLEPIHHGRRTPPTLRTKNKRKSKLSTFSPTRRSYQR